MTGFIGALPVFISMIIAAALPYSILPGSLESAFSEGGWGMRLILFAFLVSLWLIVDRVTMVLRNSINAYEYMNQLRPMLRAGDVQGALSLSQQTDRPLARIIAAGLSRAEQGEKVVLAAMDEAAYGEVPEIEKRTGYLALMGNVATLMGLFGTIVGLIHSFGAVSMSSTSENATLLAAGISEAMNCTAFGLLAGILALVAFSALNGRTQAMIDEINLNTLSAFRVWKATVRQQAAPATVRKPIKEPHAHLMENIGLLKAKGQGRGKKTTFASLQLTPLIDMFIVLVIFLLLNFSATGEIVAADKNIKLPFASKVEQLQRVPIVSISNMPDHPTRGIVALEGREVATVAELDEDTGPDWKIPKLTTQLEHRKNRWNQTNPDRPFEGRVIVQCDQDIDFRVIKKIMYSAGLAGYGNLMLAVQKRAETGG
jgi:biopolymer transport protein ExbB